MRKVYISGALTNVSNPEELKGFYEAIAGICSELGLEAYVPHLNTDPIQNSYLTPHEVFEADKYHVRTSDLIIAYIGTPSLGVGMELAYAEMLGIPIVLLYEEGRRVSRFPLGIPTVILKTEFRNYKNALAQLGAILGRKLAQYLEQSILCRN